MLFSFVKDISSEIIIIYGLIAFIVALIVFVVILDKKEKKKRIVTKTQELRLMDLRKAEEHYIDDYKKQPLAMETELKSIMPKKTIEIETKTVYPKEEIKSEEISLIKEDELTIDEDLYIEDDLEKTSAQIQLELLAKELEKAKEKEEEKIRKFEAEQEENAIISYNELLKVCDDLYDKNERIQYMDEGNEPINLEELRTRFEQVSKPEPSIVSQEIELLD